MECSRCGKPLNGKRRRSIGIQNFHLPCFRCAGCGKSLREQRAHIRDQLLWCEKDYGRRFSEICCFCHQPVTGELVTAGGKSYHRKHLKCNACGKLVESSHAEVNGQVYCKDEKCYGKARILCEVCGKVLPSKHRMTPRGNRLCSSHVDVVPCSSCGKPAWTQKSWKPESITLCPVCQETSVETGQALKVCVRKVCRGMERLGFPVGARTVKASLSAEEGIRRHMVTLTDKLPSALVVGKSDGSQEILVLAGLSDEHTMALLSHELFHIWLIRKRIQVEEPVLLEGLCEYMQWLWLRRRHHKEDARYRCKLLETNPDEIYGGGFRNCRSAVQLTGSFGCLIEYVRTNKSFPE